MKDIFTAEDAENAEDFDRIIISSRVLLLNIVQAKSLWGEERDFCHKLRGVRNDK